MSEVTMQQLGGSCPEEASWSSDNIRYSTKWERTKKKVQEKIHFRNWHNIVIDDDARRSFSDSGKFLKTPLINYVERYADELDQILKDIIIEIPSRGLLGRGPEVYPHNVLLAELDADLEYLRNLPEQWCDEFDSGPYSEVQTNSIREWIIRFVSEYTTTYGTTPPIPKADQSEEMSIDLSWQSEHFNLLVNFPADQEMSCTFYGMSLSECDTEWQGKATRQKLISSVKSFVREFIQGE